MSYRSAQVAVTVERIEGGAADLRALDAMAHEAFGDSGFSAREEIERPWSRIWIARDAAFAIVGMMIAWHVADEVHVLNVATSPALRRRGVGTALMEATLDYARRHDIRILVLEVRRGNVAAIALYRKFGFTVLGVRARYYRDNDEDAVEMMLGLGANGEILRGKDEIDITTPRE